MQNGSTVRELWHVEQGTRMLKIWDLAEFYPAKKNWKVGVGSFSRTEPLRRKSTAMVGRRGTPARVGEAVNG